MQEYTRAEYIDVTFSECKYTVDLSGVGTPNILDDQEHARHFVMSVVELLSSHTEQMEKLDEENDEIRSKLQIHDRELKEMLTEREKMTTTMQTVFDENRKLSRQNQFLRHEVIEIKAENKHLLSQVENIAKENEELTGTIILQEKDN